MAAKWREINTVDLLHPAPHRSQMRDVLICRIKCTESWIQAELTISNELVVIPHAESMSVVAVVIGVVVMHWSDYKSSVDAVARAPLLPRKRYSKWKILHSVSWTKGGWAIIARHKIDIIIIISSALRFRQRQERLCRCRIHRNDESEKLKAKTREYTHKKVSTTNRRWLIKWDKLIYLALLRLQRAIRVKCAGEREQSQRKQRIQHLVSLLRPKSK